MKVVCGWCGKHLKGDEQDELISHGICPECAAEMRLGMDALVKTMIDGGTDEQKHVD